MRATLAFTGFNNTEAYSEPSQTSAMELFTEIVKDIQQKSSILVILLGSRCASGAGMVHILGTHPQPQTRFPFRYLRDLFVTSIIIHPEFTTLLYSTFSLLLQYVDLHSVSFPSRLRICYLGTNTSLATLAKNLNSLRMPYVEKGFSIMQWLNTQKYAKGFAHSQAEIRIFTMKVWSSADEPFCS